MSATTLAELGSVLGIIAVIISIANGYFVMKKRACEPNEKRWSELEEWKKHLEKWKDSTDDKLERDYRSINRADRKIDRHHEFERLMLRSMLGIVEHLASGNHAENLQRISKQINDYLICDRHSDLNEDI